jgi:hypothetical protein
METVKVRNLGPFDRDIRPLGGDTLASVPVGGVVEVSAALGASLAEQVEAWEIVPAEEKGDDK